jgi:23S rRNA (uracil1939-C5)-methyltransferase
MRPGLSVTLTPEKPVAGGRMLARHGGAVVLVSGALPGETVEARVERVQHGTVYAATTRVIDASPDRVGEPNPCGGCVFAHVRYERQLALKQQILVDALARIGKVPLDQAPPIHPSPPSGYRMRARLHGAAGRFGFFNEGTHVLCDPATTGQLRTDTLAVLQSLAGRLNPATGVTAIELAENADATERAFHLDLARQADPSRLAALTRVDGVAGVSSSHEGSMRVRELWGVARVSDRFEGPASWTLVRGARSFFQANRFLLKPLVDAVIAGVTEGPILDLYAGVGLFGVAAAALGKGTITAVEGDRQSASDLIVNATPFEGTLRVHVDSVEAFLASDRGRFRPATVIVDPPRTGLSREARAGLSAVAPSRLVYVSCDVATLARDIRAFVEQGYRLDGLTAFDLFPNTAHVETVAVVHRGRTSR